MPAFSGGPLDGMLGYQEGLDPPAEQLAAGAAGAPPGGPPQEQELSPQARFDRILADARLLAGTDGEFSEQDKLIIEKVTSLLQQLKAAGEKDEQQAMMGKVSPGSSVLRRAYG